MRVSLAKARHKSSNTYTILISRWCLKIITRSSPFTRASRIIEITDYVVKRAARYLNHVTVENRGIFRDTCNTAAAMVNSRRARARARADGRICMYLLVSFPAAGNQFLNAPAIYRGPRLSRDSRYTSLSRDESVNSRAKVKIWGCA